MKGPQSAGTGNLAGAPPWIRSGGCWRSILESRTKASPGHLRSLDTTEGWQGSHADLGLTWVWVGLAGSSRDQPWGGACSLLELSLLLGRDPGKKEAKGLVESWEQ